MLARDGQILHSLRIDKTVRRLDWTLLAEISPALVRAVIVSEDKRFMEHDGVDWRAAGKAAWSNFWGKRTRGASTLTMQLVGLIEEDGQRRGRRSFPEKISQTTTAMRLETRWSKPQIIEAYLNLVPFRGELQGVGALSRQLFGKWPHGLDDRESALAAALLRSPNARPEVVTRRACNLLREMGRDGECESLRGFSGMALSGGASMQNAGGPQLAPHFAQKVLDTPGQSLRSSLDFALQGFARNSLRRHLRALRQQNAEDGAVVVLDNASGEILAWVGSRATFPAPPRSRRHRVAPGRLDAQTLSLRAGLRNAHTDPRLPDRGRPAHARHRQRPLRAGTTNRITRAGSRSAAPLAVRSSTRRATLVSLAPNRSSNACARPDSLACAATATGTATASRWARPTSRC